MKVAELKYERMTLETITERADEITRCVRNAKMVNEVLEARERFIELVREFITASSLSYMRYSINTVDEFYVAEKDYYDEITPKVQNCQLEFANAMLESPFRAELEKALSHLLFQYYEVQKKAMSPDIIEEMIEENRLVTEYSKLMAGITFHFRGETMPLSILRKYMKEDEAGDPARGIRGSGPEAG